MQMQLWKYLWNKKNLCLYCHLIFVDKVLLLVNMEFDGNWIELILLS